MTVRWRAALALVVVLTTVAGVRPAGAEDLSRKRDTNRHKAADILRQLDLAKASDARVEAEAARLAKSVTAQQGRLDEARQSQLAAQQRVDQATAEIAAIAARADRLRDALAQRALLSYMHPVGSVVNELLKSGSMAEASRRIRLLDEVQGQGGQLVDQYKALRGDLTDAKQTLDAARTVAARRAQAEADAAAKLQAAERAQEVTHKELTRRIDELQSESRDLAAQDTQIQALLRSQAAANAATLRGAGSGVVRNLKASAAGLIWPIHGPVTSEYGPRWGGFHSGIDIGMDTGTPIAAAKRGVVTFAGWMDGYGNFVIIDHGDGVATAYAHQTRLGCRQGQVVSQGETIGYVGSTGNSTGPHLHFEVRVNGSAQNPRAYEAGSP
jgi:murein DD-endopeptidase MepM/ murein hydrolase activator NlpD